jgi:hypothetical protein
MPAPPPQPDPTALGRWIRQGNTERHLCGLPHEWTPGAIWQCRTGHLWTVGPACPACHHYGNEQHTGLHIMGLAWWPATLGQRLRHHGRKPHPDMGAGDRTEYDHLPKLAPPHGPGAGSGVSPPPDTRR